jgi:thymidylate synthase (FAD)
MEFVEPSWWDEPEYSGSGHATFSLACKQSEDAYSEMCRLGAKPQAARAVLPNALKTEIIVTADVAEWAHIKKLRTHPSAHPDMVRLMNMMPWEEMGL